MVKIKVTDRDQSIHDVTAAEGDTLMTVLRDNGFVRGECGGLMICTTCHVKIAQTWTDRVGSTPEDEADMIDGTGNLLPGASRLGCQIEISSILDGLELTIAEDI